MSQACRRLAVPLLVLAAGCSTNPAPTFEAEADRSIRVPSALAYPGAQIKVVLPDGGAPILVWRTRIGFGAAALTCTCCGHHVWFNGPEETLDCPHGSRFGLDGELQEGDARFPLRAYAVDLDGDRLKILG